MCIYCGTNKYRKIYENHNGPIQREDNGRAYEIHHLDGNHQNNLPDNLICVPIQEHYNIHYRQGDWSACLLISRALKLSPEDKSKLARDAANKRIEGGTHNFQNSDWQRHAARERVKNGTHHWLGGEMQSKNAKKQIEVGTHYFSNKELAKERARKMLLNGTHNWLGGEIQRKNNANRIKNGTHHFLGDSNPGPKVTTQRILDGTHNWSGENHPKFDHTVYCFTHKRTKEVIYMTRSEFIKTYSLNKGNVYSLLAGGKNKSLGGWILVSKDPGSIT